MFELAELLWQGFKLIGEALLGIIQAVLGVFGIVAPDWIMQIAVIIAVLLLVFKYAKYSSKIVLIVLLLVLGSVLVNALLG